MSATAGLPGVEAAAAVGGGYPSPPRQLSVEEIKRQRKEQRERDRVSRDPLCDCRIMLRFVLESKRMLTPELEAMVAKMDGYLVRPEIGLPPISEAPLQLVTFVPPAGSAASGAPASAPSEPLPDKAGEIDRLMPLQLLLTIHRQLSGLIAPATPETLRVSEGANGIGFLGGVPSAVRLSTIMAVIGLLLFMRSFQRVRIEAKSDPAPAAVSAPPSPGPAKAADAP